eukprot:Anaeramoba_ignava/a36_144.p6 GENE.a36_144~~a36_144.p6  ORF type:complete len:118 (+),score=29.30 a36_144:1435-1788(+)
MTTNLAIDTGAPRNVTGHVVSGSLAAGALAAGINYNKYKKGQIGKNEAIQDSLKLSIQGGIVTGSSIAAANYVGEGSYMKMLTALSIGMAGVYAVEKINEKFTPRFKEEIIEEEEEK